MCLRRLADGRAEAARFTRFFNNVKVTPAEIVACAAARTGEAAAGRHVLLIEDSSEINFQSQAGRKRGLGRVGNGRDVGLFMHPVLALDAEDRSVLGLAGARIWRRLEAKAANYQALPIEAKESYRWVEPVQQAKQALAGSALLTVIADRECDIYEVFARLPDERTHVLIRATHNRALADGGRAFERLAQSPEAGRVTIAVPARPGRPAREATLALRFCPLRPRQPARGADRRDPKAVSLTAVEAREIGRPARGKPLHWRLLTTHQAASFEQALALVELYRARWAVEQLFRTLKSQALDVEDSVLESGAALERLAAAALVVAMTTLQLVHARGEAGHAVPARRVFKTREIAVLQALKRRLEGRTLKQKNPHPPESLAWAAWFIARLGGWTGYASERPPGPITMHRGLERFGAIADGFALAKHGSNQALYDVCEH